MLLERSPPNEPESMSVRLTPRLISGGDTVLDGMLGPVYGLPGRIRELFNLHVRSMY
jgi:hypothetical protein